MKNILYVNSTVGKNSRTDELARHLLKQIKGNITEVKLENEHIEPLNTETLNERNEILKNCDYQNEKLKYARQFASADTVVISAPFWDLSIPAMLKSYIENITVTNVTFKYGKDGRPIGLCKANELYFVSTAGGKFIPSFGYDYIQGLSKGLLGIPKTELIYAERLDIIGADVPTIMETAKKDITLRFARTNELNER